MNSWKIMNSPWIHIWIHEKNIWLRVYQEVSCQRIRNFWQFLKKGDSEIYSAPNVLETTNRYTESLKTTAWASVCTSWRSELSSVLHGVRVCLWPRQVKAGSCWYFWTENFVKLARKPLKTLAVALPVRDAAWAPAPPAPGSSTRTGHRQWLQAARKSGSTAAHHARRRSCQWMPAWPHCVPVASRLRLSLCCLQTTHCGPLPFVHIKHIFMHILKMRIYAYLVLHIYAYFVHIYAYGIFAYMCIFCFCIF